MKVSEGSGVRNASPLYRAGPKARQAEEKEVEKGVIQPAHSSWCGFV